MAKGVKEEITPPNPDWVELNKKEKGVVYANHNDYAFEKFVNPKRYNKINRELNASKQSSYYGS